MIDALARNLVTHFVAKSHTEGDDQRKTEDSGHEQDKNQLVVRPEGREVPILVRLIDEEGLILKEVWMQGDQEIAEVLLGITDEEARPSEVQQRV